MNKLSVTINNASIQGWKEVSFTRSSISCAIFKTGLRATREGWPALVTLTLNVSPPPPGCRSTRRTWSASPTTPTRTWLAPTVRTACWSSGSPEGLQPPAAPRRLLCSLLGQPALLSRSFTSSFFSYIFQTFVVAKKSRLCSHLHLRPAASTVHHRIEGTSCFFTALL